MGQALARQLVAAGCNVAMWDLSAEAMAESGRLCETEKSLKVLRMTARVANVWAEHRCRDEIIEQHATDRIHLLINNAGIGGDGQR